MKEYEQLVDQHPLGEPKLIHGDIHRNTLHDGKGNFWFIDWEQGRFSYYDDLGHIRGGGTSMKDIDPKKIKFVVIAILILLFGIFLGMNSKHIEVWIFGWTPELSLITITLFSFLFGCSCGYAGSVLLRKRLDSDEL